MKTDIQKMLAEAYEIEGLLLLADNRGDDTPEYVFTAIGEKLGRMQEQLNTPADNDADPAPASKGTVPVSEEHAADSEPASEEVEEQDEPEEIAEVAAEMIDEDETDTTEPEQIVEVVTEEEPLPDEAEIEDVPEEDEEEPEEDDEPVSGQAAGDTQQIRLDEKLQRSRSKDLKSAFSLNDTFRFRRELFGNSGAVMTDALHLVEAMQSYDEAEDYFYGDLGWDRESDDVKEFMAIIKNHFL